MQDRPGGLRRRAQVDQPTAGRRGATGDDHFGVLRGLQIGHQTGALTIGKLQIGKKYIGNVADKMRSRIAQGVRLGYGEALGFGKFRQGFNGFSIVIDDQYVRHEASLLVDVLVGTQRFGSA